MSSLVAAAADHLIFVIALGALVAWARSPRAAKVRFAAAAVAAAAAVGVLVTVAGRLWTDPRPFVVDHVTPLIAHSADNGFPSDHTALAMATALVVLVRDRVVGWVLVLAAVLLGAARVAVGVHHVPDILAGIAIGALAAAAAVALTRPALTGLVRAYAGRARSTSPDRTHEA